MNLSEYQTEALRTLVLEKDNLKHASYGLITEVAEIIDTFKRHEFYDIPLDVKNLKEEVGDILWYLAVGYYSQNVVMKLEPLIFSETLTLEQVLGKLVRKASDLFFFYNYCNEGDLATKDLDTLLDYLRVFCKLQGIDLLQCAEDNITKLQKRYPENFTTEQAINRDKEKELDHIEN